MLAACAFALVGGLVAYRAQILLHGEGSDLLVSLRAVHAILAGENPYAVVKPLAGWDWNTYWYYPLPEALLILPVAWLDPAIAAIVFIALSGALLGFALARLQRPWFPVLLSVPFLLAAQLAQISPLVLALGLLPGLSGLAFVKPNLGISLFAWRPSRRAVVVALVVFGASLVVLPTWPGDWLDAASHSTSHSAPFTRGIGLVGLLSILRWRRPEARLLFFMTLLPNTVWFYDELPLFLVPSSRREAIVLALASWVGWFAWLGDGGLQHVDATILNAGPWVVLSMYVPATVMVLLRANEGSLPIQVEERIQRLPSWLRGSDRPDGFSPAINEARSRR